MTTVKSHTRMSKKGRTVQVKGHFRKGSVVRVHPQLTSDPWNMRGRVGIIKKINPKYDTVLVGFLEGSGGIYTDLSLIDLDITKSKLNKMFEKEKKEHPEMSDKVIWRIIEDHIKMREKL